jgi:hypothetical protein
MRVSVRWDLIHFGMEYAYSDLIPMQFYAIVFDTYKAGRFPCNWNEVWPHGRIWLY